MQKFNVLVVVILVVSAPCASKAGIIDVSNGYADARWGAVSNAGVVFNISNGVAYWDAATSETADLIPPSSGHSNFRPADINNSGQITTVSTDPMGIARLTRWHNGTEGTSPVDTSGFLDQLFEPLIARDGEYIVGKGRVFSGNRQDVFRVAPDDAVSTIRSAPQNGNRSENDYVISPSGLPLAGRSVRQDLSQYIWVSRGIGETNVLDSDLGFVSLEPVAVTNQNVVSIATEDVNGTRSNVLADGLSPLQTLMVEGVDYLAIESGTALAGEFQATLVTHFDGTSGIVDQDGNDIVREGQSLFGRTVVDLGFRPRVALSDDGSIVFDVEFSDGSTAVALFQNVPEPGTGWLITIAFAGIVARRFK